MAYTVQLSDGTNTVNLIDGTTYQVLPNGIQHGPPSPRRAMSPESLLEDGSDLIDERFSNRRVTLRLHIMGATKDALIQGVRDIQALLEKARSRQVTGFGPDVTLTLQWDGAANSFTLDVLDGQLFYPANLWSKALLDLNHRIADARLELLCRPFARRPLVTLAGDTLENEQDSGADANYTDLTTIEGDVAALAEIKLVPSGATGSKKIYVGTRSGSRRTDNLWRQGESVDAEENLGGETNWTYAGSNIVDATASDGSHRRFTLTRGAAAAQHPAEPVWLFKFDLGASFPQGLFRVLARVKGGATPGDEPAAADLEFGAGWKFGSVTRSPQTFLGLTALGVFQLVDLGEVRLPPFPQPETGFTFATRELHIQAKIASAWNPLQGSSATWDLDYVFLLPADESVAIVNNVGATDRILIDSRSHRAQIYLLDASDNVQRVADYLGKPVRLSPRGVRIYVLRDDGRDVTYTFSGAYVPRYWDLA